MPHPITTAVNQNLQLNLGLLSALTKDIADDQMGAQPTANLNHATWQLGHIVYSVGAAGGMLGAQDIVPDHYAARYGMGSTCQPVGDLDADKQTLLAQIDTAAQAIRTRLPDTPDDHLASPFPVEPLRDAIPTVGDGLVFLTGSHFAYHLGMLSAWRRTIGLGSALGM